MKVRINENVIIFQSYYTKSDFISYYIGSDGYLTGIGFEVRAKLAVDRMIKSMTKKLNNELYGGHNDQT
jgi:hypothetical protein